MTNSVNLREIVLELLLEILEKGAYSHRMLGQVLEKYQYLEKQERAFITRTVEGTLERRIQIDAVLGRYSKTPVKKMKPVIRNILRSGVYQICFMDAVPDAAACNEAVKLAEKKGFHNLKGFVNGVLRTISRNKNDIPYPDAKKEPEQYLSVKYSIPEWMIRLWKQDFCYDWGNPCDWQQMEEMLQAFLVPAPTAIRTNLALTSPEQLKEVLEAEGVAAEPAKLPYAFFITGYDRLSALPSFQKGLFSVQDISSMMVVETAKPKQGDFVVDLCASPGGKAMHAAEWMKGTGKVLARDVTEKKIRLIEENCQRCHISNLQTQVWDAMEEDASLFQKADIVLADLPCSGLGVLRKKKDIREKMTAEKMNELVKLQRRILASSVNYVKPKGKLVYSTCTIHKAENEETVEWLLENFPQFVLEESCQILPGKGAGDGFYYALLRKEEG